MSSLAPDATSLSTAGPVLVPDYSTAEKKPAAGMASLFDGFLLTYLLTVGSLIVVGFLWGKMGFDWLVVAMGWPHVVFGLAFNLNKIKGADQRSQLAFAGLLLAVLVIGFIHSQVPITTLIYLYFIFHAFRDEIFIYHQRTTGHRFRGSVFDRRGLAWLAATVAISIPGQLLSRDPRKQLEWYYVLGGLSLALVAMTLLPGRWRVLRDLPGTRYGIAAYFLIVSAMIGMKLLRTHGRPAPLFFAFLVVFHYWSWYVFSFEKIAARGQTSLHSGGGEFSFFQWISTRRGFLTAMVVMNVLSIACAYAYQVRHLSATLAYGFDLKYFLYFLVLHVTTSFAPKNPIRIPKMTSAPAV